MRIDVSEVKSFRECGRKWELSSRNTNHLVPLVQNDAFRFGTLMHEALHSMYLGVNPDDVLDKTIRELTDPAQVRVMTTIIRGYATQILPDDLERYRVLDIEHKFQFTPPALADALYPSVDLATGEVTYAPIVLCGSIDMIVLDTWDNSIWGFEHKSAKTFRDSLYIKMDEQPRLYTEALQNYVDEHNALRLAKDENLEPFKLGGIFVNQCKKTVKFFAHQRDACVYTVEDRQRFMSAFAATCERIAESVMSSMPPEPGMMKCQMCDYKSVCEHVGYCDVNLAEILDEFSEEFKVREGDHLDDKVERTLED